MFDKWVLCDDGFENVVKDNKKVGFQMKSLVNYYRGIPLSMIDDIAVRIDGEEVEKDKISLSVGEDFFTLRDMETVGTIKWEFDEKAVIFIEKEGGLGKGPHEVTLTQVIRVAYYPFPCASTNAKTLVIYE